MCAHRHTHTHPQFTYERYISTYSLYPLSYIHRRLWQHQTIFQHQELLYLRHSFLYPYHQSTLTYIGDFLLSQGRCKHQVLGDGNCLFSSLSHQLYGTVEYYSQLWSGLVQLIEKNDSTYWKYWIKRMDWGNVTFGDHMQWVKNNGTYLNCKHPVTISLCLSIYGSKNPSGIVQWEKKAIPRNQNLVTTSSTCALPHPIFPSRTCVQISTLWQYRTTQEHAHSVTTTCE